MWRSISVLLVLAVVASGCAKGAGSHSAKAGRGVSVTSGVSAKGIHSAHAEVPDSEALLRLQALGYPVAPVPGAPRETLASAASRTTGNAHADSQSAAVSLQPAELDHRGSVSAGCVSEAKLTLVSAAGFPTNEDCQAFRPRSSPAIECSAGSMSAAIVVSGATLLPHLEAKQAFGAEGVLWRVLVQRGQRVKQGELLAELDPNVALAAIEAQKVRLEVARLRSENTIPLRASEQVLSYQQYSGNAIESANARAPGAVSPLECRRQILDHNRAWLGVSQSQADLREASLIVAQITAELHAAQKALEQRQIRAKFDGEVVSVFFKPGEFVKEAGVIELADFTRLRLEGEVSDKEARCLDPAQDTVVELKLAGAERDEPVSARLDWISPKALAGKRQFSALVENRRLQGADGRQSWMIWPGARVTAEIRLSNQILSARSQEQSTTPSSTISRPTEARNRQTHRSRWFTPPERFSVRILAA